MLLFLILLLLILFNALLFFSKLFLDLLLSNSLLSKIFCFILDELFFSLFFLLKLILTFFLLVLLQDKFIYNFAYSSILTLAFFLFSKFIEFAIESKTSFFL